MYILHPTIIYVESNVTRSLLKKKTTYTALVNSAKPMATNIIQKKTQFIGVPDFENTVLVRPRDRTHDLLLYHSAVKHPSGQRYFRNIKFSVLNSILLTS